MVVLPAPLGPRSAKTSPLHTPNVTSSTAVDLPNAFVRWRTRRPSFELATLHSSTEVFSSRFIFSSRSVEGFAFRKVRLGAPSSHRRRPNSINDWTVRYRMGPP